VYGNRGTALDGQEQLAIDNRQQAFLRGVLRRAGESGMNIHELNRTMSNREAALMARLQAIRNHHKLMLAALDAAIVCRNVADELRQADEDRRARLARIAAANEP
jgi:hypothetical protein